MCALGNGKVAQIGIVVRDIDRSRERWARLLGVEPPPIIQTAGFETAQTHFRGLPTPATAKLCFFESGQVQIELIQPDGEDITWQEHMDRNGESVQHIAFVVPNIQASVSQLAEMDIGVSMRGEFKGGRYAYLDTRASLGVDLELLENDQ